MQDRAVLYLRLSKEDKDKLRKGDESASIMNQRLLLTEYALEHCYKIVETYSDDDESGLYDTRPDFERMLLDGKLGKYDIILSKSQSRFSRNMEHIEKYLHHDLPNLGIRFIGVVDGTDTANQENKKSRQINGLVNEWYCEDLSQNIRSALKAKMQAGKYLGASYPYGYIKDPNDHNHLVIDEYAANVVRRIYQLYLQGYGKGKIGKILSEEGVLIPSHYKRQIQGISYYNSHELETTKNWSYQTIHTILNNEVYIGTVVQHKYSNPSYKDKKHIKQPEEEWIRVEHQHEPIIAEEIFYKAKQRQKIRTKQVHTEQTPAVFSGILFCADCKHTMVRMYERYGQHAWCGYCCKTYKTQGKIKCKSHKIYNEPLEKAVLNSLQEEAKRILTEEDIAELREFQKCCAFKTEGRTQISKLEKEITRYQQYKKKTYQNYLEEIIDKEAYFTYTMEYDSKLQMLQEKLRDSKQQIKAAEQLRKESNQWCERFVDYININVLKRTVVCELIEKIEVHGDERISIYYKFQSPSTMKKGGTKGK